MRPTGLDSYLRFLDDREQAEDIEDQISYLSKCLKAGALLATADGMIHDLTRDTVEESRSSRNEDVTDGRELNKITLCEIKPITVIKAKVNLDERVVLDIQEGQTVSLDVPALGRTGIPGTVSRISRVSVPDAKMGKYEVAIDVGNDDGALLPGMTVIARITAGERECRRGSSGCPRQHQGTGRSLYRRRPENGEAERPRGCRAGDLGR